MQRTLGKAVIKVLDRWWLHAMVVGLEWLGILIQKLLFQTVRQPPVSKSSALATDLERGTGALLKACASVPKASGRAWKFVVHRVFGQAEHVIGMRSLQYDSSV